MKITLAEIPFGSIQGEGNTTGKISTFIRFSKCNFRCTWCDSKHTWNENKDTIVYSDENHLIEDNKKLLGQNNNIVFTGGEPLLFQEQIVDISNKLEQLAIIPFKTTYEIETNLAISIESLPFIKWCRYKENSIQFNISPKLQFDYSKVVDNIKLLNKFNIPFILKFVDEGSTETREEILKFITEINFSREINNGKIFIMPECVTREEHINRFERTIEFCKEYGFNFTARTHILLWDKKRRV